MTVPKILFCLLSPLLMVAARASATTEPAQDPGYLSGKPLNYTVPPPPSDLDALKLDLVEVRSLQQLPTSEIWQDAEADSRAYAAADIIRRFDDASGEILDEHTRPILVAMLGHVISDAAFYAQQAKSTYPRPRPYVEDTTVKPCNTGWLKGNESYPSGHAMNGYAVAVVLSKVLSPEREQAILARGVRYGTNRVICGVHHATDVEQGRLLALAYLKMLSASDDFQRDLACAKEEDALVTKKQPMSATCQKRKSASVESLQHAPATTPGKRLL